MSTVNKAPVEARGENSDLIKSNYLLRYSSGQSDPTGEFFFLFFCAPPVDAGEVFPTRLRATGACLTVISPLAPRSYAHVLFTSVTQSSI